MTDSLHDTIIARYFADENKEVRLKAGDVLLNQNELNNRLYYVEKGRLTAYLPDKHLPEPVFQADEKNFIGVYSFFSNDNISYSHVVADQDSVVRYFDGNPFTLPDEEARELLSFLFGIVVGELKQRQTFAGQMAKDRQDTLQKLIKSEKMVTLGQMAAGIAHELNNTIASLSSNLGQVKDTIVAFLKKNEPTDIQHHFQSGMDDGQQVSSAEARELRQSYAKFKHVSKATAKKLGRAGIQAQEIKKIGKDKDRIDKIADLWELGYLLHDMQTAATQAAHVIKSTKSLGVANQSWSKEVNVNQTLLDAEAILRSLTKKIEVVSDYDEDLPLTEACPCELVQVWINLIKNAVESLLAANTENPKVTIQTRVKRKRIRVRISDNGPGIPEEMYEKVFQPNFTTKVGGLSFGLGLGLTIVKRIINEHNGSVKLVSKPGHTAFTIYLPIVL